MVTFTEISLIGINTWLVTWTSDVVGAIFRVFRDGILVSTQATTEYVLSMAEGEGMPVVEVLDDPDIAPQPGFPGYFYLGWAPSEDEDLYIVSELVAGPAFVELARIKKQQGIAWMIFNTGLLDDLSEHIYVIVPVDAAGNEGTGTGFQAAVGPALMVRHPDTPETEWSYDAVNEQVVIAA